MDDTKISSNKNFGIVFFVFFLIIGIYPLIKGQDVRISLIIISVFFLILGLMNSKLLTPLNKTWYKFGIFLGRIVSPLVMSVIFFFVVTPIGLFMRILGKDILNLKFNKNQSYWIEKNYPKSKMKNQF